MVFVHERAVMSTLNLHENQQNLLPPHWTTFVPESVYHQKAQTGQAISSSMLKEFRNSPARYFARIAGKIPGKECSAFRIGRAVHKLILEGEPAYRAAFAVGGPFNQRTGRSYGSDTKAFRDWVDENGLDPGRVVTVSEAHDIACMREAVRRHKGAVELLRHGWPERSVEAECLGLPCQARFDWLTPDGAAADVKTTRCLDDFENEARRYGYLHQFAFYREVARAAGAGPLRMAAVVVEKKTPFRVCVWRFPESVLEPYAAENRHALVRLLRCRETGEWPSGFEAGRTFPPAGIPALWLN